MQEVTCILSACRLCSNIHWTKSCNTATLMAFRIVSCQYADQTCGCVTYTFGVFLILGWVWPLTSAGNCNKSLSSLFFECFFDHYLTATCEWSRVHRDHTAPITQIFACKSKQKITRGITVSSFDVILISISKWRERGRKSKHFFKARLLKMAIWSVTFQHMSVRWWSQVQSTSWRKKGSFQDPGEWLDLHPAWEPSPSFSCPVNQPPGISDKWTWQITEGMRANGIVTRKPHRK